MGKIGVTELLIVLAIVVLLFGVGRISKVSGEIGKSINAFKKGLSDQPEDQPGDEKPEDKK
jgi:sec-independent protein translocase protein TatA